MTCRLYIILLLTIAIAQQSSTATEVSKAPKIVDLVDKINHPEGTNATLMCSIGSGELDSLTFEWLKDERRIVPSNRLRLSTAAENFNSMLRLIDLKPSDTGVYTCVAKNSYGQDKISIKLFVKVQLKWTIEPEDLEVSVGKPVHIPCRADGSPEPRVEWFKVESSQSMGSELRFGSIAQDDAGYYECRASNGAEKDLIKRIKVNVLAIATINKQSTATEGKSERATSRERRTLSPLDSGTIQILNHNPLVNITVSKAPKIVNLVDKINHPEGTNATFTCSIGSGELESLSFEWLKDDRRIVTSNRLRLSTAPENYQSNLRVIDLKPTDAGAYTCLAKNPYGQDKISIKLFVKVQLKWINEPESVEISVGKSVHIPCRADGSPEPRVEWFKAESLGQSLGSELRFSSINQADAGYYECRASNGVEKDLIKRVKVDVLGK